MKDEGKNCRWEARNLTTSFEYVCVTVGGMLGESRWATSRTRKVETDPNGHVTRSPMEDDKKFNDDHKKCTEKDIIDYLADFVKFGYAGGTDCFAAISINETPEGGISLTIESAKIWITEFPGKGFFQKTAMADVTACGEASLAEKDAFAHRIIDGLIGTYFCNGLWTTIRMETNDSQAIMIRNEIPGIRQMDVMRTGRVRSYFGYPESTIIAIPSLAIEYAKKTIVDSDGMNSSFSIAVLGGNALHGLAIILKGMSIQEAFNGYLLMKPIREKSGKFEFRNRLSEESLLAEYLK